MSLRSSLKRGVFERIEFGYTSEVLHAGRLKYREIDHPDWKYEVAEPIEVQTGIKGRSAQVWRKGKLLGQLRPDGIARIEVGYAWDGASGPTWDTTGNPVFFGKIPTGSTMRASLFHDFLYQLCRLNKLDYSLRKHIDKLFRRILIEDGVSAFRAWYYYQGVRKFAWWAAKPRYYNA